MGQEESRPVKPLQRLDVEVTAENVYQHLELARGRKINELATRERELRDKLRQRTMAYEDVCLELISVVNLFRYIKAAKIVMRYCQLIKEHSLQIVECCRSRNFKPVRELVPYFEGLVWAADRLNLKCVKEFNALFLTHFGPDVYTTMKNSKFVDQELRDCFDTIEPSPREINDYLRQFLDRHKIALNWPGNHPAPAPPGPGGLPPLKAPAAPSQPHDDFNDMINQLKDDDFSVKPSAEKPNFFTPPPAPAQQSTFQPPAQKSALQPPAQQSAFRPPANAPAAPKRGFDKVARIRPAAKEVMTEENDENAEDLNMDEIPLAIRLREMRDNRV